MKSRLFSLPANVIWVSAAAVVMSIISLGNMTRWSIWFDEAFGAYLVRFGYTGIAQYTAVDVHPPLYYWVLKLWTDIFGTTELAFRSLSLVFAIVALVGVFVLIKKLFRSDLLAVVAAWAVALSPMLIRYTDEARMYTMVAAIAIWATYVLVRLQEKSSKKLWLSYAVLIAAGMWTHYFAALIWLTHWVWRIVLVRDNYAKGERLKAFFTKQWIVTHIIAVALFAAWIPFLVVQFVTIQIGFWIPPLSLTTPFDYLTATLTYLTHEWINGWYVIFSLVTISLIVWAIIAASSELRRISKEGFALIVSLSVVPPVLLFILSLPPLKPSFVDRYVLTSMVMLAVLASISIATLIVKYRSRVAKLAAVALVASFGLGILHVYQYGNYNFITRNSIRTEQIMSEIAAQGTDNQPVIANTPWIYYEAAFYSTNQHPVFFLDASTDYEYGSLAMLRDHQNGKINNLSEFSKSNRYVWYFGNIGEAAIAPPVASWKQIKTIEIYDSINKASLYKAALYDTTPSAE